MAFSQRTLPAHLTEHEDDEHAGQRGYVKGTDFALPYFSQWSRLHAADLNDGLFRHINCGYLSTHGVPPTLLALKQHAQSLCALIHALDPTLKSAEVSTDPEGDDDDEPLTPPYDPNDAFDFLTDLTVPYTNDDPSHHKPLAALANEVRGRHEVYGTTYHCPFAEITTPAQPSDDTNPNGSNEPENLRPYATHQNLILHANACLERLDHEFSATGGLLSLLPSPDPPTSTDHLNARTTLLGQYLHFTRLLISRTHALERAYGEALDLLSGEAAVPRAHLSALGPDGRSTGRDLLVYPQDLWVLANAGDDVFEYVHGLLDREEAAWGVREGVWRGEGVVGGGMGGRGVVGVDVVTRYYRLAGSSSTGSRGTLFVLPAWEQHPGVAHTRALADKPTVVAAPAPKFPARATELEKRYTARLDAAQVTELENLRLQAEVDRMGAEAGSLKAHNAYLASTRDALMLAVGEDQAQLAGQVQQQRERATRAEGEVAEVKRERDEAVEREEVLKEQVEELKRGAVELMGLLKRRAPREV